MSKDKSVVNKYVAVMALSGVLISPVSVLAKEPKQLVEQLCSSCHSLKNLERSTGYSQEHWKTLISYMVDTGSDTQLTQDVSAYLAEHYPVNAKRESKVVAGDIKLQFKYWQVPTFGQRARDPVQGENGIIMVGWPMGEYSR